MAVTKLDDPHFVWKDITEVSEPLPGLQQCWKNYWWVQHPETKKIAFWQMCKGVPLNPLANSSEEITRRLVDMTFLGTTVVQVPLVFQRINPHDYV